MSNFVFVLDTNKQPLEPCSPTIAKKLLKAGKAAVFRQYPFTIILKKAVDKRELLPCQLKLDPGSVTTGIAILQDNKLIGKVAVRSSGSFNIKTVTQTVQGISYKYCKQVHRKDGYVYGF